jgi:hypothetical protein
VTAGGQVPEGHEEELTTLRNVGLIDVPIWELAFLLDGGLDREAITLIPELPDQSSS